MPEHKFSNHKIKALDFTLEDLKTLSDQVIRMMTDQTDLVTTNISLYRGDDEVKVRSIAELENILLQFEEWQKPEKVDVSFYYHARLSLLGSGVMPTTENEYRTLSVNIRKDGCFVYISGETANWVYHARDRLMAFMKSKQVAWPKQIIRTCMPLFAFMASMSVGGLIWGVGLASSIIHRWPFAFPVMMLGVAVFVISTPLVNIYSKKLPGKNRFDFTLVPRVSRTNAI